MSEQAVVQVGGIGKPPVQDLHVSIPDNVRLDYRRLAEFCWSRPSDIDVDLFYVAELVHQADRVFQRRWASTGWSRDLHLVVPVHAPEAWHGAENALSNCLSYLTGDDWSFTFEARGHRPEEPIQCELRAPLKSSPIVLPYSDGLDSFLARHLLSDGTRPLVTVTAHHDTTLQVAEFGGSTPVHHLKIPISTRALGRRKREKTCRSRTFLFFTISAIAGRLAGADSVHVPEGGIGCLGPSLVVTGDEWPHVGAHPHFATLLHQFLETLRQGGNPFPRFRFPFLWKTKGQTLREFLDVGGQSQDALTTNSCSASAYRKRSGLPRRCGVCPGCMFTRVSMQEAGVGEPPKYFLWHDIAASHLEKSCSRREIDTVSANVEMAHRAVFNLACASRIDRTDLQRRWIHELRESIGECDVEGAVVSLFEQFSKEWNSFLHRLPTSSWVRQVDRVAGVLP